MYLKRVHVKEFRSVWDSSPFEINDITCLVGKNEAGKTALLHALYRLNPIIPADGQFDPVDDYPRAYVDDYQIDIESKDRSPAVVVEATFELSDEEAITITNIYGKDVFQSETVTLSKGYANTLFVSVGVNENRFLTNLLKRHPQLKAVSEPLRKKMTLENFDTVLSSVEESPKSKPLREKIEAIKKHKSIGMYLYNSYLKEKLPKFLYFDDYYQMKGHDNLEALRQRKAKGTLEKHDYPLLGLIDLARLDFEELLNPERTRKLKNKLEGAGNHLTRKIVKYWSQNRHLKLKFDVRPAQEGDPPGMRSGTNIWGDVEDTIHAVTTELGTRSKGFVWFFSFLAWYQQLLKDEGSIVLLLDEPGLSLHGRAQEDLLRYFESEIKGKHQLIYTTHSPFMVDSRKFDRVRIVQDKSIDADEELPESEQGTKVFTDVLSANDDSLFPLQGALGYEVYQTLFIGPNCLIVEGVSDLLYLQTISGILDKSGGTSLDARWTITPVGGSDKVPTFVALIGANTKLKLATLIDVQNKDKQTIDNLYKRKLLKKKNVLTYADFSAGQEADVEDMFDVGFYLELFNAEYNSVLTKPISEADLPTGGDRLVPRIEQYLDANPMLNNTRFSHYRPARYFMENISPLESKISVDTLERFEAAFVELNKLL